MKRLPVLVSFALFIALCATIAYWVMEYTKPPLRPIAPPPRAAQSDVTVTSAAQLFGGNRAVAVAANYQLRGVVVAGNPEESVAILSADGKPPQAVRAGREILPGTIVKEVAARHVLLSEGGVIKRVDLPESVASTPAPGTANPLGGRGNQQFGQPQFGQPQIPQLPQIPPRPGQALTRQPGQNDFPPGQPQDESPVPPRASEQIPGQRPGSVIPETGLPPGFPPPDEGPSGEEFDPGAPPEQQAIPPEMQQ